jgi:regulator of RNase E activity RraA
VTVQPGDFVIGDSDGVVVVPAGRAGEICARAAEQQAKEDEIMRRIRTGEPLAQIFGID